MKRMFVFIALMVALKLVGQTSEDDGFRSIAEYRASDPNVVAHLEAKTIDDVFGTPDVVKQLSEIKRVRLFRRLSELDESAMSYMDFSTSASLESKLKEPHTIVNVAPAAYQPLLQLTADFNQYSDQTLCVFNPGVALILGDKPEFIMICCFACHEVCVIRRPTDREPELKEVYFSISPELERAIFDLTLLSYPEDKTLQKFKLKERQRAKTPLTKVPLGASGKDPFGQKLNPEQH
jgi:hypothetical protein